MSANNTVTPIDLPDGRVRAVIERVLPSVDGGRFPVKRIVGDRVDVTADCFADGHDVVACALLWRRAGAAKWESTPMTALGNDRWQSAFVVDALGAWEYTVCAWVDPMLSWQHDFARRVDVEDVHIAARTGCALMDETAQRAKRGADAKPLRAWSVELAKALDSGASVDELKRIGMDTARSEVAQRHPDLRHANHFPQIFGVAVERERARFSAWYEFFPRSASSDPKRHGNFADCEAWLPYVKKMGFDVLYFPPIHPVGRSRRKGPNNTLDAKAGDVGSPWAIGAAEGGHEAILSELGTLADFQRLVKRAAELDIDIALDIAFQCAPDHPWVTEHPEWFKKRADGSIQYAENPPKKYQDIYPFDFETSDWQGLWQELKSIFEFWIAQGVTVFRVDNPHTKSFHFWEWCIRELKQARPELIFLSEAFTRPKLMYGLAKRGFTQSYTYFTWRTSKAELTEYMLELTQGAPREFFGPNFWPNTPDILTPQFYPGQRAVFLTRAALAATLTASWGLYGPVYEQLQHTQAPGREEYLDNEKYEIHHWDLHRAGNISWFIATLNRIRHAHPALQQNAGLRFHRVEMDYRESEQIIAYSKATADLRDIIVVVINLDPSNAQSGWVELPTAEWGLGASYEVQDLISGASYSWSGQFNYVELDPATMPAHILLVRRGEDITPEVGDYI